MDTALLVVTVLSLAAALMSVWAVRRMKHHDEQRSEARVAALAAAAAGDALSIAPHERGLSSRPLGAGFTPPQNDVAAAPKGADTLRTAADSPSFFGTVQRETPTDGRFAFVAAAALIVALGGAAVVFTTSGHGEDGAPAAAARAVPLELVLLGHSREDSALTIAGMVHNPPSGPKLEGLTAVVSLIDTHGGLISTQDVPLDYRALGPGEEAPFKVTVPDPGSVARYRVSFRAGVDIIPHVDRRSDAKLASAL